MTRRLLDYDPISGMSTWFDYEKSTDSMVITNEQDGSHISRILDQAKAFRNDDDYSKQGIKEDWWHYARIPNGVILEMKEKHGVDLMARKIDWKKAFKVINREYPALKVTTKTHA